MQRPKYLHVLEQLNVLVVLKDFEVCAVETPPLGIAVQQSDIDLVCHYIAGQSEQLIQCLKQFQHLSEWSLQRWSEDDEVYLCRFIFQAWPIEIFCSTQPVTEQAAYRHFQVERRLLDLADQTFRDRVIELKLQGMKTEPAFAKLLHLNGDAFQSILRLYDADDQYLTALLKQQGW